MSNDWQQGPSHQNDNGQGATPDDAQPGSARPGSAQQDAAWGQPQADQFQSQAGQFQNQPDHQPPVVQPGSKPRLDNNDILAIILALIFPGLGQIMLGQTTKGAVLLAVALFTCGGLGLLTIVSALDAYCVAMTRKTRPIEDWEFFPNINELF
jgi:TM2 domain-containing membrane protein YozV